MPPMKRAVFLLFLIFTAIPAFATTYYTAKDCSGGSAPPLCSNANNGLTRQTAELTIAAGLAHLGAADTLIIGDGTYDEQIYNQIPSGSAGNLTTIQAEHRRQVLIKPLSPVTAQGVIEFYNLARSYIKIDGLVLDGTNIQDIDIIESDGNDASHVATNITITNSTVQNGTHADSCLLHVCATSGIATAANGHMFAYTSSWTITNNICDTVGYLGHGHCIYLSSGGNTVSGNILKHSQGYCVQSYNASNPGDNNVIEQNEMSDCSLGSSDGNYNGTSAIILSGGSGHIVRNNVIYSSCDGIQSTASTSSIDHNTFHANTKCTGGSHADLRIISGSTNNLRNNICYGSSSCTIENGGTGTTNTGNLVDGTNPLFTNATGHDYTLTVASPAINTVSCPATVTNDFIGTTRPVGTLCDKGAYEYNGDATTPIVTTPAASDLFTRSDSSDLGANWLPVAPGRDCRILSNAVYPSSPNLGCFEVWTAGTFTANQTAMATISTWVASGDSQVGVSVRNSTAGTARTLYACVARRGGSNTSFIRKYVDDTGTDLVTENAITWAATDVIMCAAKGPLISMSRNGTVILTATDTEIAGGNPGLTLYNDTSEANVALDNWSATRTGSKPIFRSSIITTGR